jgi:hypothetical protein
MSVRLFRTVRSAGEPGASGTELDQARAATVSPVCVLTRRRDALSGSGSNPRFVDLTTSTPSTPLLARDWRALDVSCCVAGTSKVLKPWLKSSMPMALASGSPVTIAMDLMGETCLPVGGACLDAQEAITLMNTTKRTFRTAFFIVDLGVGRTDLSLSRKWPSRPSLPDARRLAKHEGLQARASVRPRGSSCEKLGGACRRLMTLSNANEVD